MFRSKITLALFIAIILMMFAFPSQSGAVPAAPVTHTLIQPGGAEFEARQWGDERSHGWETLEGHTIIFDEGVNSWAYAVHDVDGSLKSSSMIVGKDIPYSVPTKLRPAFVAREKAYSGMASSAPLFTSSPSEANVPPVPFTQKVLVIMVSFLDQSPTYTASSFQSLIFSASVSSVTKYYNEVSYGNFHLVPAAESSSTVNDGVVGWIQLSQNHPDCEQYTDPVTYAACYRGLASDAIQASNAYVNFASFDTNGNGTLTTDELSIILVIAGHEYSFNGLIPSNVPGVWAHQWTLGTPLTLDGKSLNYYAMFGEIHGSTQAGNQHQATLGVMAHELGHLMLGLPDLYDTDGSSEGIGNWSLMASGSWNKVTTSGYGDSPAHPDAWSKYYLGWVTPAQVTGVMLNEAVTAASSAGDVYKLRAGTPLSGEYFLVENRQKSGYDTGLPGAGLLIWHIDGSKINTALSSNSVNDYECYPGGPSCLSDHYGVKLVQADNLWHLEHKFTPSNPGDAGDPYPGTSNKTSLSGKTSPDNSLYNTSSGQIGLSNISVSGPVMTATLDGGSCSYSISPLSPAIGPAGGNLSVTVTAAAGCGWTAVSNAGWLTITSGSTGSGNGTVNYAVSMNPGVGSRTGTMTVAGVTFTVTQAGRSRPGIYSDGQWYLDLNGNGSWDGTPMDRLYSFGAGLSGAIAVSGDWNGSGASKIGIFTDGTWYLDLNGNGIWNGTPTDGIYSFGVGLSGAVPVSGDWNGNGTAKIGIYADGTWYLDLNGNGSWDGTPTDGIYSFGVGLAGAVPVAGDWNGNNITRIGIFSDGQWYLDLNGNGTWDGTPTDRIYSFGIGLSGAVPMAGDWNGTGPSKIGIFTDGTWYLDYNGNGTWDGTPMDSLYSFGVGLTGALPVTGRW